ncbi:MAG TPA: hypothetical protein VHX13_09665 [Acidobacteriaceae bacterium]|nr:hypothetical protein [Acidobacteriaceae bacterium]
MANGAKTPQLPGDDGTRALLRAGLAILVAGVLAAVLTATVFGGISRQGPHTNAGWLSLMVAMMCMPFGLMLFVLGAAKWLRHRRPRRG